MKKLILKTLSALVLKHLPDFFVQLSSDFLYFLYPGALAIQMVHNAANAADTLPKSLSNRTPPFYRLLEVQYSFDSNLTE